MAHPDVVATTSGASSTQRVRYQSRGFRHTERSHDRFEAELLAHCHNHFNGDRRRAGQRSPVEKTGRIVRLQDDSASFEIAPVALETLQRVRVL